MPGDIIQCLSFNNNQDCFVCGLDSGLRVYNTDPLVEKQHLESDIVGSVSCCVLLHRTNLIALVGGGPKAKFAENSVLLWDDLKQKIVLEITFSTPVLGVKISHSKLVVALRRKIHVFTLQPKCVRVGNVETRDNPLGICGLSCDPEIQETLVFPGHKMGSVQLVDLKLMKVGASVSPVCVNAHQSEVVCLSINNQGTLFATGSALGTVIRLFDTRTKSLLSEFRRGSDPATLHCINLSPDSRFLCVSSDKGTVHIFAVRDRSSNKKTILQQVGIVTEEAQRSLAQFSLPTEASAVCGFGPGLSVIALCKDGTFHKFMFTLEGNCNREGYDHFLELGDDLHFWNVSK